MANSWSESGTTWGTDRWGTTDEITLGWGGQSWNNNQWGNLSDATLTLTGISLTTPFFSHVTMQNMCLFISSSVHLDLKFLPSFSSDCLKVFFSKILSLACQFVCSS